MILLVLALFLASACGTVLPTPVPVTLSLAASASVAPQAGELAAAYETAYPYVTVDLQLAANSPAAERLVATGSADAALITRPPDQSPLATLAAQQVSTGTLAVIVHPDNPLPGLTMAELHDVFTGAQRDWAALGPGSGTIQVAVREQGSGTRAAFDAAVLPEGGLTTTALILPGSQPMLDYVATNPLAIGYIAREWLTATVRPLPLDAIPPGLQSPDSPAYPLALPIYLVTPQPPAPPAAAFQAWLQGPASPLSR